MQGGIEEPSGADFKQYLKSRIHGSEMAPAVNPTPWFHRGKEPRKTRRYCQSETSCEWRRERDQSTFQCVKRGIRSLTSCAAPIGAPDKIRISVFVLMT